MRKTSGILADTSELRKLILEYPDYPIAVVCSEDVNCGDYSWMYASDITFSVGEILGERTPFEEEIVYCDRDEFEEDLEEWLWEWLADDDGTYPEDEIFREKLEEEKAKYEPHWRKCIIIWTNN